MIRSYSVLNIRAVDEDAQIITGIATSPTPDRLGDIIEPLGVIDYKFQANGKLIHKTVHHFLLRQIGGELTVENDPDHEAIDIKWVALDDLSGILAHENERRMALGVIEWVERNR